MTQTIIEQLKIEIEDWHSRANLARAAYLLHKADSQKMEKELAKLKRSERKIYKAYLDARKNKEKAKRKLSQFPSQLRRWGKNNPGKAFNYLQKVK